MQYDIEQIRSNTKLAKCFLQEDFGRFQKLHKIGEGRLASGVIVREFKDIAVRRSPIHPNYNPFVLDFNIIVPKPEKKMLETMIKHQRLIDDKVHCAPIVDYAISNSERPELFQFMPRIKGPLLSDVDDAINNLLKIGKDGFEIYFHDWIKIYEAGLSLDIYEKNMICDGEHIYHIDIDNNSGPKPQSFNAKDKINSAARFVLSHLRSIMSEKIHKSDFACPKIVEKREKVDTIKRNLIDALKVTPHNERAMMTAKVYD